MEHTSLYGPTPICALDTPLTCIGVHPLATHLIKSACENALMHASGHRVYEGIRGITTPPLSSVTGHEQSSMWIHSPHSPFGSRRYVVRTVKPIGKVFSYMSIVPLFLKFEIFFFLKFEIFKIPDFKIRDFKIRLLTTRSAPEAVFEPTKLQIYTFIYKTTPDT